MFWPKSLQSVNTLHTQFVKAVLGSVTIVTIQTMAYIDELDKTGENDQKWPKIWGKNEKNFQKKIVVQFVSEPFFSFCWLSVNWKQLSIGDRLKCANYCLF